MTFVELIKLEFKPFTEYDWHGFAGCVSKEPLICYTEKAIYIIEPDTNELIVIDGKEMDNQTVYSLIKLYEI